jgi:hypothetical protein
LEDVANILEAQKQLLKAKLQKRPSDPKVHWMTKIAERPEVSNRTKENQIGSRLELPVEINASRGGIIELRDDSPTADAIPRVPMLQIINQSADRRVDEPVDEPL